MKAIIRNKKRHELMVAASGVNGVAWDGEEFDDDDKNLNMKF